MAGSDSEGIEGTLRAARSCLDRERRRTVDELQALSAFADRLEDLRPTRASPSGGGVATIGASTAGSAGKLRAVREAYEATVMSVPHYDEEYGDTYERSVRAEFGPEVGGALVSGAAFDARCKQALLAAVERSREERERLRSAIDEERDAVADAPDELGPLADRIAEIEAAPFPERRAPELDAYRDELRELDERCETLAAERQDDLVRQRRALRLPTDEPDVPTFAYRDLDVTYPILSVVAALAERVDDCLAAVERELAYR